MLRRLSILFTLAFFAACQTSAPKTGSSNRENSMVITITPVETNWLSAEDRWRLLVDVRFTNDGEQLFQLDKATACSGGRVQNHVFVVQVGDEEIEYGGMMKKRAPPGPDGFHRLKSGQSVTERVDLGEDYAVPESAPAITVRFDHYNHFSPDGIQLVSAPVRIELTP